MTNNDSESEQDVDWQPPTAPENNGSWVRALVALSLIAALVLWPASRMYALALLALLLLIGVHEGGHLLAARSVGVGAPEYSIGFGPVLWRSKKPSKRGTRYVWRAVPLGGYVRIDGLGIALEGKGDPAPNAKSYDDVSAWKRVWVSVAGPAANIALAFVILAAVIGSFGVQKPSTKLLPVAGSPAAIAGVLDGDVVRSINGIAITSWDDVSAAVESTTIGKPTTLVVERAGKDIALSITPEASDTNQPHLGISSVTTRKHMGPARSVTYSAVTVGRLTWTTVISMGDMGRAVFNAPSQLTGSNKGSTTEPRLMSPVGAAQLAAQASKDVGPAGPVMLIAAVSIFLAVFNLLPLPPLDGGHIAIATYEGISSSVRRKRVRVDQRKLAPLIALVISVVLVVGLVGLLLDLIHPVAH